jgi:hypothetical protein
MSWHEITMRIVNNVLNLTDLHGQPTTVKGVAPGVAETDAANVGQVKARTPQITVGQTPPSDPDTNDLWVIT